MTKKLSLPAVITAPVVHGRGLGHSLGAPTVNQALTDALAHLPYGVYFSRCTVDGETYTAVTNVGVKPTVSDGDAVPVAETHLLDFSGDLYESDAVTELLVFRRGERKFESQEALSCAIADDIAAARDYFKSRSE